MTEILAAPRSDGRDQPAHGVSMSEAFRVWLRVAALSFGGPAGQIAVMHRILVEEKKWVSESRFLHALNYCMLLPGPEAQQLAIYIGWLMHRTRGGVMAGGLFILRGVVALMVLSIVYAEWGHVGFVAGAFFGLKAAVLAVVVEGFMAAFRAPGMLPPLLAGALGGLLATWVTFTPCFLWIFVGAPYIEQLRGNKALSGALSAITAAVVGVILNLSIWFSVHALFRDTRHVNGFGLSFDAPVPASLNVWSLVLALGAAIAIFRFKVGMIPTLAASCVAGVLLYALSLATPL